MGPLPCPLNQLMPGRDPHRRAKHEAELDCGDGQWSTGSADYPDLGGRITVAFEPMSAPNGGEVRVDDFER